MKQQLSLVELAIYGYTPTRVKEGSWLQQTFGSKNEEVKVNECTGRFDQNKDNQSER